ncbi:ATP-binding protein [Amorphoplanes digitatis]|uniref:Transitional endoplasmic reticulum ATPase n=1 Tax=Actinoplanes digitatis TaxID=1868 RepID=A0A7W7MTS1_9ACTN|nr:ATP-binding protein [Actinoplanes digitatis]MBB4765769.1 transitional endoplasmic reticulum ATPase [Actinoplanes digitatis]GID93439.1 hypothetical protein Adi01nite_28510 [Actinoplanes digitatis]
MAPRTTVRVVPLGDRQAFADRIAEAEHDGRTTLGDLLREGPALALQPLDGLAGTPVVSLSVEIVDPGPDQPLYRPPGMVVDGTAAAAPPADPGPPAEQRPMEGARPAAGHPEVIDEATTVRIAYDEQIRQTAEYLAADLSVLVRCEKLLVEHLALEMAGRSGHHVKVIPAESAGGKPSGVLAGGGAGRRQQILTELQVAVRHCGKRDVIVVAHLDLLAGGSDAALGAEARELIDVLYERSKVVLLAFVDPSLVIPEVLANRFAVRVDIDILPREVLAESGEPIPIGTALVTRDEAERFEGFQPVQFYKHIAGLNAVRLRHAMIYASHVHPRGVFQDLLDELRKFKARTTASSFEVPNVTLDDIGGYGDVRKELLRALALLNEPERIPKKFRSELLPKGFIFYGPPGTGKTLFAKAVATAMNATILVVSGPEVTDMYVGESERKVREIFAEARRNAPSIIVFDEIDSIASRRSGREDGGSRAGNAIVAQLLTEMDGFRPEVQVLIIGTTNRLDIIDEALLRPSRFRAVAIGLPDRDARREIAAVHARHFQVTVRDAVLDRMALVTRDMNGDEIRSIFRDARVDQLLTSPDGDVGPDRLGTVVGRLRQGRHQRDLNREQGASDHPEADPPATETDDDVVL